MDEDQILRIAILPNYTPEMVSLVLSGAVELIETLTDGLTDDDNPSENDAINAVCRTLQEMANEVC
jgi:hypothetical protein